MSNPFHHFWLFLYAVWDHAVTLAAGCVVTVMLGIIEKRILKRPVSAKVEVGILLAFVFFACFQAWRDQYEKAKNIATVPTVQITMPPITVPPAQVVITPAPTQQQSHDWTGFVEVAGVGMRTETIAKDAPISVNVGYVVKGSQPVNAFSSVNNGALVDYDKKVDAALEKQSEESLGKAFSKGLEDVKRQIARKEIKGHKLGIDNGIAWSTVTSLPLTEKQVNGILSGQTRFYLLNWATWKDSNNRVGVVEVCQWMQAPKSLDLYKEKIVWHFCEWIP